MGKKIDIEYELLDDAIININNALDEFKPIVEDKFSEDIDELKDLNSDFVNLLIDMLELIQESGIENVVSNIETYVDEAKVIYDEIKNVDETLASVREETGIVYGRIK